MRFRWAWRRLSPFFTSSRGRVALLVVLSVLAGLFEAVLLALIAAIAASLSEGEATITQQFGPLTVSLQRSTTFVVAIAIALVRALLQLALARLPAQMSARVLADLRRELFESYTRSAWSTKAKERDGAFQALMTLNSRDASLGIVHLGLGVTAAIMFLTMTFAAFVQNALAAAVLLVAALGLFLALRPLSRMLRKSSREQSQENVSFTGAVQEIVHIAEETEVFGASEAYRSEVQRQVEAVRRPYAKTNFLAVAIPSLYQSVALVLLVIALITVSVSGVAHLAALAAVILMLLRALNYARQIQTAMSHIDERVSFMNQIVDALERYRSSPQQEGSAGVGDIAELAVSQVSFAYEPGSDVLHDVSFELRVGEAIGVVGPSGAGKSSIVQIVLRLRDPHAGAVLVNGTDARTIRRSDWQRKVAYVPQASRLIWGTVRENIRFYRDWVDDDDVVAAARRAHIHEEILSWPSGYDTVIGQRASAVSGGQGQRICLARALAGRPQVLVLDEPTSALDVRSEELVQRSLQEIKRDTLTILVAHRLSTLAVCDRIVVMVDGRVSAVGSHTTLVDNNDFYREVTRITQRQSAEG